MTNCLMIAVGVLQIGAGAWSSCQGNALLAIMSFCVGVANIAISKASG